MSVTKKQYQEMTKKASPNSKSYRNIPLAFIVGGLICMLGEAIKQWAVGRGVSADTAGAGAAVGLIFITALLTGLGVFDNISKYGGAGALVPITGFANAMVSPALEFKNEGFVVGVGGKLFSIAGAVICYGLCAGVAYGLIIYIFKLY